MGKQSTPARASGLTARSKTPRTAGTASARTSPTKTKTQKARKSTARRAVAPAGLLVVLAGLMLLIGLSGGCATSQLAGMDSVAASGDAQRAIATTIADQAIVQQWLADMSGQAINPGLFLTYETVTRFGYQLDGSSVQWGLEAGGDGAGSLSDGSRQAIIDAITKDPTLIEAMQEALRQQGQRTADTAVAPG